MGEGGSKVVLVVFKIFYFLVNKGGEMNQNIAKCQWLLNLGCGSQDLFYFSVCLRDFFFGALQCNPEGIVIIVVKHSDQGGVVLV